MLDWSFLLLSFLRGIVFFCAATDLNWIRKQSCVFVRIVTSNYVDMYWIQWWTVEHTHPCVYIVVLTAFYHPKSTSDGVRICTVF